MPFFESPELRIDWDEQGKCVVMEWKGFVSGKKFRDAVDKGLELLVAKQGCKWLADLSQMALISPEDQKWSDEDWFPRAAKSGIKYMAMVRPQMVLSQMSVRNATHRIGDLHIETAYFETMAQAREWLNSH